MTITTRHMNKDEFRDKDYNNFLDGMKRSFNLFKDKPLFTTDSGDLFKIFLKSLPGGKIRQHYNCNSCRHFINKYGGLVHIDTDGVTIPAMWAFSINIHSVFYSAFQAVYTKVREAKVTGVFLSEDNIYGTEFAGGWSHLHVVPSNTFKHLTLTPGQAMAEKKEDFKMLRSASLDYSIKTVETAVSMLSTDTLYRSEKVLGVAEWFLKLLNDVKKTPLKTKDNVIWSYVASGPPGFAHIRSSMIGTLLDDIQSKYYNLDEIAARFKTKMNPLSYQRPQAPPKEGTIDQAEKLVAKMGIEDSFKRRFATLNDMRLIWEPREGKKQAKQARNSKGMFCKLREEDNYHTEYSTVFKGGNVTFSKFWREVIPNATEMWYMTKPNFTKDNFITFTTATDVFAKPILQWDHENDRNPVAWYVYSGGRTSYDYGLTGGTLVKVTGISLLPTMWGNYLLPNHEVGAALLLEGCKDSSNNLGLFPECMKSELHGVRSVVECYSRTNKLTGYSEASACGIDLRAYPKTIRVKLQGKAGYFDYTIDRWD
jgi:hypothetical protein